MSEDKEFTETFELYSETLAVLIVDINIRFMFEDHVSNESVTDIIKKFQNHPNIIEIKETIKAILVFQLLKKRMLIGKLIRLVHLRPFCKMIFR